MSLLEDIQSLIVESNSFYKNKKYNKALSITEKAYNLAKENQNFNEIIKNKIEFNLAFLSLMNGDLIMAKEYLDSIKESPLLVSKREEVALIYTQLAIEFKQQKEDGITNSNKEYIIKSCDCYESAARLFSKLKKWLTYCQIELAHANLLSDLSLFNESFAILKKVQMACLHTDCISEDELVNIYCDISTIFAKDIHSNHSASHAMRLLGKALQLIENKESSVDIYIYQNIVAVWNQLENYKKSLEIIERLNKIFETDYNCNKLETHIPLIDIKKNIGRLDVNLDEGDLDRRFLSDVKYNEGYARTNLKQYIEAISAFYFSHQFALKSNFQFKFLFLKVNYVKFKKDNKKLKKYFFKL